MSANELKYPLLKLVFYLHLIDDLWSFIKKPAAKTTEKLARIKVYETIGLFLLKVIFSLVIASVISLFYEPENITDSNMKERFSPIIYLIVGGLVLPSFEEISFRLSLKAKPVYFALTSFALSYYFITKLILKSNISLVDDSFFIRILLAAGFGISIFSVLQYKRLIKKLQVFWHSNFRWIYYLSCALFAWLHILNFKITVLNLLLLPVLTLPQLFSGAIAGYTRIAFGFRYPLFMHMATNILFISLSFLPID
jgi:hypothetical protein